MVARVSCVRRISPPTDRYPKSRAARLASNARPIFVGEVREAIVGTPTS